jgi:ATP-binding cassette subfamily C (CFTR/MRP) protein 1
MVGFRFSQPLLTRRAVALLSESDNENKKEVGALLIVATALIYLGIAFSTAHFRHHIYRTMTMVRGGLATLIHDVTLELSAAAVSNGAAMTLMSTDIDRIVLGLEDFDSLFAAPIEIGLAIFLLYRDIGLACVMPVVVVVCKCRTVLPKSRMGLFNSILTLPRSSQHDRCVSHWRNHGEGTKKVGRRG